MKRRAFLSPCINPLVVALVRLLMPFGCGVLLRGLQFEMDPADVARLKAYRGQRMLLLPNHPNGEEPFVLFELASRLGEVFNFVAAREVFDWQHGFRGWLLRRVGAYSVVRGASDRESFLMTRQILMEGKNRLVIFIEGEISRDTETLIPFEPGVIQLACWAQEALARQAKNGAQSALPVYLAPVAIKYFYASGSEKAAAQALTQLEKTVGLQIQPGLPPGQRIRRIGEVVLRVQEELHRLNPHHQDAPAHRVQRIIDRMLQKMELFLDVTPDTDGTPLARVREIRNQMDHLVHAYEAPAVLSAYEQHRLAHLRKTFAEFYEDLDRVVYFLSYKGTYEAAEAAAETPERWIDMIRRLEKEIFGEARLLYPRVARLQVGAIRNLQTALPEYEADKKHFPKHLAQALEREVTDLLHQAQRPPHF